MLSFHTFSVSCPPSFFGLFLWVHYTSCWGQRVGTTCSSIWMATGWEQQPRESEDAGVQILFSFQRLVVHSPRVGSRSCLVGSGSGQGSRAKESPPLCCARALPRGTCKQEAIP